MRKLELTGAGAVVLAAAMVLPVPALGRHSDPPCRSGVGVVIHDDGSSTPWVQSPRWGCEGPGVYIDREQPGTGESGRSPTEAESSAVQASFEALRARRAGNRVRVSGALRPALGGQRIQVRLRAGNTTRTRTAVTNRRGRFVTALSTGSNRTRRVTVSVSDTDEYHGTSRTIRVEG